MTHPISIQEFFIVLLGCTATIAACRCIPLFLLKGKTLSPKVEDALSLIPPAAFAALVANDLLTPGMIVEKGLWGAIMPILSSLIVALVAKKTGSLIWCALTGVAVYAALSLIA